MAKKLLMNNYLGDNIDWTYVKESDIPVQLSVLCKDKLAGYHLVFSPNSDSQIFEVMITKCSYSSNDPQFMLLNDTEYGCKIYWIQGDGRIGIGNSQTKIDATYPVKIRLISTKGIFSLFINDELVETGEVYSNKWLTINGVQRADLLEVLYFKYANFEE